MSLQACLAQAYIPGQGHNLQANEQAIPDLARNTWTLVFLKCFVLTILVAGALGGHGPRGSPKRANR